jgi:peptidoglycan hydrolase CwlO-like protein
MDVFIISNLHRAKVELEEKVAELQSELSQANWKNVSLQSDNTRLQDSVQQTKVSGGFCI